MPDSGSSLDWLFHPRSIALAGITVSNPQHWTRAFLDGLVSFGFQPLYLVNPKGGEINGQKVYPSIQEIPDEIDYVISTVSAQMAPTLVEECARQGVKAVQFCTAGFAESGDKPGTELQARLTKLARQTGVRIIGPNCLGIYYPQQRISYVPFLPRESGNVAVISQSGTNLTHLIMKTSARGVRFSKAVSYGNACDLNESDFLEYLADDPETTIIALYIEGVNDGKRFRRAIEEAAGEKTVILLKGGVSRGGTRAAASHTGSLAGSQTAWSALCRQYGVIQTGTMAELCDVVVTCSQFRPLPHGRKAAVVTFGGGSTILLADELEQIGIEIPPLPEEIVKSLSEYTSATGNILGNPMDYSQQFAEPQKVANTFRLISRWDGIDLVIGYIDLPDPSPGARRWALTMIEAIHEGVKGGPKPVAIVLDSSTFSQEDGFLSPVVQKCVAHGFAVYCNPTSAARAISLVLDRAEIIRTPLTLPRTIATNL